MIKLVIRRYCERSGCKRRSKEKRLVPEAELEATLAALRKENRGRCTRDFGPMRMSLEWRTASC